MHVAARRLVLLALTACAQPSLPTAPRPRAAAAEPAPQIASAIAAGRARLQALVAAEPIAGLQVAVALRGTIVWSEGFGFADLATRRVVEPRTTFRAASVSKVITVGLLAVLVQAGKLDLDAPIGHYLPKLPAHLAPITARQLAGHLAGVRHYTSADGVRRVDERHFATVTDSLANFQDDPLVTPPGAKYAYSSYGFVLLSAVLEAAAGAPFLDALAAQVLAPLGMRDTGPDDVTRIRPARTVLYQRSDAGTLVDADATDPSSKWAGGGMLTTSEDLVRFASGHVHGGPLAAPAIAATLFTSQIDGDGKPTGVGIGWRIADGDRRHFHHAGAMDGARSIVLVYPDAQLAIAILSNTTGRPGPIHELAIDLAAPFLDPPNPAGAVPGR